jgi:hypothetical protein
MKLSNLSKDYLKVLNLVISGIPSILNMADVNTVVETLF